MDRTVGVLALARPTFDVDFANEMLVSMFRLLDHTGAKLTGKRELLMDADAARQALHDLVADRVDSILVLQVTFTDAAMICEIGRSFAGTLAIWSVPEPRSGGRLRLNSFCGLNLASHALALRGREFSCLHADPQGNGIAEKLAALLTGSNQVVPVYATAPQIPAGSQARSIAASLKGARIGRIGQHPDGFDTCAYDRGQLRALAGVEVDEIELEELFDRARAAEAEEVEEARATAAFDLDGLGDVDHDQLERSLRLKSALESLRHDGHHDAYAIRCWPETFTEYGGAVCGPVSMMGENRVPCACEADVYGALSQLVLQRVCGVPVFLADLVDVDEDDDTAVVWHCGQAPVSMAATDSRPVATVHSNRKMPLLYEFALKPGPVTFLRISQARGNRFMVTGKGRMLRRLKAFSGTSGVVRFDNGTSRVLDTIIRAGLEHHLTLAYGNHIDMLRQVAAALDLPVLEI